MNAAKYTASMTQNDDCNCVHFSAAADHRDMLTSSKFHLSLCLW